MCGIFGIAGATSPGDARLADAMGGALRHRGPDEGGLRLSPLGFHGMRRLSIIDLSSGSQPVPNETEDIWVSLNGEIYNYRSLRSDLQALGHHFRTQSDTEVLVHAYEAWGDDFVTRLRGMFAIAIWDERRGRVLLARDRIGKKPLYFTQSAGRLLYGSELKTLLLDSALPRRIEPRAVWHYLTFKHVPAPYAIVENVFTLPAGHYATYEDGRLLVREYWRPRFAGDAQLGEEEAADRLLEVLDDAIRVRVDASDVPVGAFLSGGIDSSLVVGLMARHAPKPLKTFAMGYARPVDHKNDLAFARLAAREFGTEHEELIVSVEDVVGALPRIVAAFDEPFGGTLSPFWLSATIASHVKVALSGDGADELFGSYAAHRMASVVGQIRALGPDAADFGSFAGRRDLALACAAEPDAVWRTRFGAFSDAEKSEVLAPEWSGFEPTSSLLAPQFATASGDLVNAVLEIECRNYLPDGVLTYVDRLSMAHSLEVRVPFLDQNVVDFAGSLPGSLKVRPGATKAVLKTAARRVLPSAIVDRPKEGFVLPMDAWLARELCPLADDLFSAAALDAHGIFQRKTVQRLWSDHRSGTADHTYKIWSLMMFQLWYGAYAAGDGAVSACLAQEVH